jgi:2'-hydroxyisoflavone reductase
MKLLVLGGTVFLGRHIVQAALNQGVDVTMLNRGRHGADLFPGVPRLVGDRDGDMSVLRGRAFDAVIDCSGYTPAQIDRTTEALGHAVAHYVFVSSISVHAAFPPGVPYDEGAAVLSGNEGYGAQKARAEEAIEAALPGRVARVRPGLIVGPFDPTGRFTYWPLRVARAGKVLAPGRPQRPVQFIDARDLALWCLHLARARITGVFNAVSAGLAMADLLEACRDVAASDARFVWLGDSAVLAEGIEPWTGLPLWVPESDPEFGGMLLADNRRALAAGLKLRAPRETVSDTLRWACGDDNVAGASPSTPAATLTPEAEARSLMAYGH